MLLHIGLYNVKVSNIYGLLKMCSQLSVVSSLPAVTAIFSLLLDKELPSILLRQRLLQCLAKKTVYFNCVAFTLVFYFVLFGH